MLSIISLSAKFDDEVHHYEPWVNAVVEYRKRLELVGVYRTDEFDRVESSEPSLCLLVMAWNSDRDVEQAYRAYDEGGAEGYRAYLSSGPQLEVSTAFGSVTDQGELLHLTDNLVQQLSKELNIVSQAATTEPPVWDEVHLDIADRRATFAVDVSSSASRCRQLEELLPGWLSRAVTIAKRRGRTPEETPAISVTKSVAETLTLPVFDPRSRGI